MEPSQDADLASTQSIMPSRKCSVHPHLPALCGVAQFYRGPGGPEALNPKPEAVYHGLGFRV